MKAKEKQVLFIENLMESKDLYSQNQADREGLQYIDHKIGLNSLSKMEASSIINMLVDLPAKPKDLNPIEIKVVKWSLDSIIRKVKANSDFRMRLFNDCRVAEKYTYENISQEQAIKIIEICKEFKVKKVVDYATKYIK